MRSPRPWSGRRCRRPRGPPPTPVPEVRAQHVHAVLGVAQRIAGHGVADVKYAIGIHTSTDGSRRRYGNVGHNPGLINSVCTRRVDDRPRARLLPMSLRVRFVRSTMRPFRRATSGTPWVSSRSRATPSKPRPSTRHAARPLHHRVVGLATLGPTDGRLPRHHLHPVVVRVGDELGEQPAASNSEVGGSPTGFTTWR